MCENCKLHKNTFLFLNFLFLVYHLYSIIVPTYIFDKSLIFILFTLWATFIYIHTLLIICDVYIDNLLTLLIGYILGQITPII